MKNISEQLHCWKVFCEKVFQIRSELSKRNYWWLAVWKIAQISQDWIKTLSLINYYERRSISKKKIKFLYKSKTTAIAKSFVKNRIKNRKYFSAQQYQYFRKFRRYTSAIEQNRFIQRNKKNVPRRDILRILVAVIPRFNVSHPKV